MKNKINLKNYKKIRPINCQISDIITARKKLAFSQNAKLTKYEQIAYSLSIITNEKNNYEK